MLSSVETDPAAIRLVIFDVNCCSDTAGKEAESVLLDAAKKLNSAKQHLR
jgi:hypothetical protein